MTHVQGCKYLWKLPDHDHQAISSVAAAYNLSFPIAQTLLTRGLKSPEEIESFLLSSPEKDVAHPSLLKNAEKAVDRIMYAIKNKEKILIAGDYDVDGITSSALMMLCLLPLGARINFFLPNRVIDGYGLSTKTIKRAAQNNYKVIITVDNGITAFEPALLAKQLGVDLIITDHHRPHDNLPDAFAIIDPHQESCPYPYKKFAGVGVSFKILSLLYEKLGKKLPDKVYELLMLGTIADVVPLTGENRFWVRYGLRHINEVESFSLKILKQNARVSKPFLSASDVGFFLAPQINALGRLEDAREGVAFLIGADKKETERIGSILKELNEARKEIERSILADIELDIQDKKINLEHERVIVAVSDKWPPGVIGLVASRLVSQYNRPAIVLHVTKEGIVKGSCRSIPEFNMFDALHNARDLLKTFGGHASAAGLSLTYELLPEFKKNIEHQVTSKLTALDFQPKLSLDAELSLPEAQKKLMADMAYLEPFGNSNPQPLFYIKNVTLCEKPSILKDAHVKCSIFADGIIKPVIFFNRPELYKQLVAQGMHSFDIAVYVMENQWNGRTTIELQGIDIAGLTQ